MVRNEVLQLLSSLVRAAPSELANILAFQGAFEQLLGIAEVITRAEGSEQEGVGGSAVRYF